MICRNWSCNFNSIQLYSNGANYQLHALTRKTKKEKHTQRKKRETTKKEPKRQRAREEGAALKIA